MTTGKVIGDVVQYRLDTPIASGAFSTVWRCSELSSGRTYAVKIVEKKAALQNKMTGALIREVNALEIAGSAPYVTRLVDKMVSKHNYYLVMDLAEGGTLLDLIRERRQELKQSQVSSSGGCSVMDPLQLSATPFMPYDRVQYYFKQLLLALSALHDRNVVHRDVKPENILLDKNRTRLLLSDFGFACHSVLGAPLHRACGTLKYCAPELLRENPSYDGRKVDVWAAGITLYMMLFGGYPYRCSRGDPDAFLEVIETTTYRIPRPIPALIEDILKHMLCVDSTQRWSVKQLLQHPWIVGLDLRSPSASPATLANTSSGEVLATLPASVPEVEGAMTEMPSKDCLPVDFLPSNEDEVDDGFYQSINHDHLSSSVSSGLHSGSLSIQQPQQGPLHVDPRRVHKEAFPLPFSPSMVHSSDPDVVQGGELETRGASKDFVLHPPSRSLRPSPKEEILKYGTESTSLTSIESFNTIDDEGEMGDSEDDTSYCEEMCEGAATRDHFGNTSMSSSLYTGDLHASNVQHNGPWSRYSYGLWLTARMAAHLVAFIAVCVVTVMLRVFLKRDIIDLPLPQVIRDRISFFLCTPLSRYHRYHSGEEPTLSHSRGGSLTASALALCYRSGRSDSSSPRPPMTPPIPGSSLRRYVRTADKLMRESFMGNVVLSHNTPLMNIAHNKAPVSCPQKHSEDRPLSSTPATSSLVTVVPTQSSANQQSMESGEATTAEAYTENVERPALPLPLSSEKRQININPSVPLAGEDGEGCTQQHDRQGSDSSLRKERGSRWSLPPPLISVEDPVSTTAVTTSLRTLTSAKTPVRSEAPVNSQEGATDDTGSCDSTLDKSAYLPHPPVMFSPIAPMPMASDDHRHEMEDFPVVTKTTGHACELRE